MGKRGTSPKDISEVKWPRLGSADMPSEIFANYSWPQSLGLMFPCTLPANIPLLSPSE